MHVIVTAGGKPVVGEPLYSLTTGKYKALLPLAGKPMIQWVLDALNGSTRVESIVVVGLPPDQPLISSKPLQIIPDHGDMLANIAAGSAEILRHYPTATHALVAASDIPALTTEMVDWLIDQVGAGQYDVYYNVIEREVMERRFSGSRRTYTPLRNQQVCGGDLNVLRLSLAGQENPLWKRLVDARKSPLHLASTLGFDILALLILHRLSLAQAEKMISQRIGLAGRVLVCPFPELGMDIDKPFQFELLQNDLAHRSEG